MMMMKVGGEKFNIGREKRKVRGMPGLRLSDIPQHNYNKVTPHYFLYLAQSYDFLSNCQSSLPKQTDPLKLCTIKSIPLMKKLQNLCKPPEIFTYLFSIDDFFPRLC